jgi:hypothetical protein
VKRRARLDRCPRSAGSNRSLHAKQLIGIRFFATRAAGAYNPALQERNIL